MKKITVVAAVVALGVLGGVGVGGPVGASQGAVVVRGTQTPVTGSPDHYTMTGGLIGDWVQTSFNLLGYTPSGAVRGSGTEVFTGCYNANGNLTCDDGEPAGSISFSFTYTGRFDPNFNLLHGRCHHPVTGGTNDFANVSGVLSFHDDPVTGCSSYMGNLRL